MADEFMSITEARRLLPRIAQTAGSGATRYFITNQGNPQAVLLGYDEYQGFIAAIQLLTHPEDLESLERGLAQDSKLSFEEVRLNLEKREAARSASNARAYGGISASAEPDGTAKHLQDRLYAQLEGMQASLQQMADRLDSAKIAPARPAHPGVIGTARQAVRETGKKPETMPEQRRFLTGSKA